MTSLNVFRVVGELDAPPPGGLDGLVVRELLDVSAVYDHIEDGFVARLYVPRTRPTRPKWAPFVEAAFPDVSIGQSTMLKALFLVWLRGNDREALFAIPFGHTRHGIDQDRIEPAFGRRTALNLIYEEGEDGEVSGGWSIHVNKPLSFDQLPGLLASLDEAHEQTTYRTYFSWVDKVTAVKEQELITALKAQTLGMLPRIAPMKAVTGELPPPGDAWAAEMKFDGMLH